MDGWKTIEPDIWAPAQPGDSIEGVLLAKQPKAGEISAMYSLETKDGIRKVWGSTILDDRMQFVEIGKRCRITFVEVTKNRRNQDLKIYRVEVSSE